MTKLSSSATAFYKKVFPVIWFGSVAISLGVGLTQEGGKNAAVFLPVPCLMLVVGFLVMKKYLWDLADEVYDGGDFLLIKNGGREHRLPLADVINVNSSLHVNPPRITLRLANISGTGPLGAEVSFSPQKRFTLNPLAKHPIAEDLIVRVDRARSGRTG